MVTNPFFKKQNINAFINLFKYAQQFYGQKMKNEFSFSMFYSEPPYADLIFSDAAQKITVLNESEYYTDKTRQVNYAVSEKEVGCDNIDNDDKGDRWSW